MASIRIHFDGAMAAQHNIALRALSKSLTHLQSSIDRAYLDVKYQGIWKYAKLKAEDYSEVNFLTGMSQEGGYILDFAAQNAMSKEIVNRISRALQPAVDRAMRGGDSETRKIIEQMTLKKESLKSDLGRPLQYEDLVNNPPEQVIRKYGDRSIVKEIDQMASILRTRDSDDGSSIELKFYGDTSSTFTFDRPLSKRFHQVVSKRDLGDPIIYDVKVISLNHGNLSGKVFNLVSKKEAKVTCENEDDFFKLKPFLGRSESVKIIASPMIEYGTFDPVAGDIYFLGLAQDG
jgi:hypothetical protein